MMTNKYISSNNDVKGARTARKGSSSGNGQRQADRGRYHAKPCLVSHQLRGCDGLSPSTSRSGTATVASAKITKKLECVSRNTCQLAISAQDSNHQYMSVPNLKRILNFVDFYYGPVGPKVYQKCCEFLTCMHYIAISKKSKFSRNPSRGDGLEP